MSEDNTQRLLLARLSAEEAGGGGGGGSTRVSANGNIFDVIQGPGEKKTESLEDIARLHSAPECKGLMEIGATPTQIPFLNVLLGNITIESFVKTIDFLANFRQIRSGSIWNTKRQTFFGRGGGE